MSVTKLNTIMTESNQDVIDLLEYILEIAKNGEILSIGLCTVQTEGNIGEFIAGYRDTAALLGASMIMQDRLKTRLLKD